MTEPRRQAAKILAENRAQVEALRDLLLERQVIDAATLKQVLKP